MGATDKVGYTRVFGVCWTKSGMIDIDRFLNVWGGPVTLGSTSENLFILLCAERMALLIVHRGK